MRNFYYLFFAILLISCDLLTPTDVLPTTYQKETIVYKTIAGVDSNLLSLDLYHFSQLGADRPIVVYVHGGAWAVGDKANQLDHKLALFQKENYLFISVNYRLSPENSDFGPNRIKFPDHNEDVADAVKWIWENVAQYGGDRDKMVLMGHSAGAHLVSLTGTSQAFLPERGLNLSSIKGIISLDTRAYDVAEVASEGNQIYINAFGTNEADWAAASPIKQIIPEVVYPSFFIAKRGNLGRRASADRFAARLESVGTSVTLVDGSAYTHQEINTAVGDASDEVITPTLLTFLETCFD